MSIRSTEAKYLVDSVTGKRYRIGGCLISQRPSELPKFGLSRKLSNPDLPPSVDLRQIMTPVVDQGDINSCVGSTLAGAYEFLVMKNVKKQINVSRLFIYYNSRSRENTNTYEMHDDGTSIMSAVKGLMRFGCCKEEKFSYIPENVNKKPPDYCYEEAAKYKIKYALILSTDLNEMKGCLSDGFPFAFGIQTFESFSKAGKNGGRILMPNVATEKKNDQYGWHAMLAVGYSDLSRCFIARNSWGDDWGDKGYCYIPYEYMGNADLCKDLHCIKLVDDDSARRRTTNDVVNPYNWNVDKNKPYYIPPNYAYQDFDYTFFWKLNDTFNYFSNVWNQGKVISTPTKVSPSEHATNDPQSLVIPRTETPKTLILWIDKSNLENTHINNRITNENDVKVDFCETFSGAIEYLTRSKNKIRASSNFQIICRGFYSEENKNPLNLLRFLNDNSLGHIPIIVFTQDKARLVGHLQKQTASMDLHSWHNRLYITNSSEDLVAKVKERIDFKLTR